MIIDAHTHYGTCFEERDGADPSRWLQLLDAEGIDGAAMSGLRSLLAAEDTSIAKCNDVLAEVVARAPRRLVAFATVHPFAGEAAVREAERCFQTHHMKGIKLHPWLQGFMRLGGREMHDLCDACGAAAKPILFHDGTSNVSMPAQIAMLARAHPQTNFILGHGGLMHLWRQAAEAAARCPNVYIVLCGPHPRALRHICDTVPTERILWGSDYGFDFANPIAYRKKLVSLLNLDTGAYRAVMGENIAALLKWRQEAD